MKGTFTPEPQDQTAWFRHFCGVIFDGFPGLKRLRDLLHGDIAFKYTLNSMDTEEDFEIIHS